MKRHFIIFFILILPNPILSTANNKINTITKIVFQSIQKDTTEYKIKGIIKSSDTKEVISYVAIYTDDKRITTLSDKDGQFELKLPEYYFKHKTFIRFSLVGYEEQKIRLKRKHITAGIKIYLRQIVTILY